MKQTTKRLGILNNAGFSLVEILISMYVFSFGAVGALMFVAASLQANHTSKEITVATSHAEYVLEEMSERTTLNEITGQNWSTWASQQGLNSLHSELITVSYEDPNAIPLVINVNVTWARGEKPFQLALKTKMTKEN